MKRPGGWAVILATLSMAGCTGAELERGTTGDREEVAGAVAARLGTDPAAAFGPSDDAVAESAVRSLLEGELDDGAAVKIALLNNRDVRAAYEALGISRAGLVQAGLLTNPVFAGNLKSFSVGPEVEMGLAQAFLDLFHRPLRMRLATSELDAEKARVTRDLVRLAFDVRRALARVQASMVMQDMRRQALAAAEASHELMRDLHGAGNVTDPVLTVEAVGVARAKLDLAAAEAEAVEEHEPLTALLGLWGASVSWRAAPAPDDPPVADRDLESLESRSIGASLDLRQSRAGIDAAAQAAGLTEWGILVPGTSAGVEVKREAGGGWGVGPALTLPVPLLDQGQARNTAAAAELRLRIDRYHQLAVEVRSAARRFRERFDTLRRRADYLRIVLVPLRARLVRETLQNYNAMQIGAFEVLRVKRDAIEAEHEYLETLRDARLAGLDLQELLAGSLNRERLASRLSAGPEEQEPNMTGGH